MLLFQEDTEFQKYESENAEEMMPSQEVRGVEKEEPEKEQAKQKVQHF